MASSKKYDYHAHGELQRAYSCGIYAVKQEYYDEVVDIYLPDVMGEVDLWGRVAEFRKGYRAEYCMVTSLKINSHGEFADKMFTDEFGLSAAQVCDMLSKRYECPVTMEK